MKPEQIAYEYAHVMSDDIRKRLSEAIESYATQQKIELLLELRSVVQGKVFNLFAEYFSDNGRLVTPDLVDGEIGALFDKELSKLKQKGE